MPEVLWSYKTTECKSTGATPFLLVHGAKTVILAKIAEKSIRTDSLFEPLNDQMLKLAL